MVCLIASYAQIISQLYRRALLERITPQNPKNLKFKTSYWKIETLDHASFEVVFKTLNIPLSAVAYRLLDSTVNLCTKFEMLRFIQSNCGSQNIKDLVGLATNRSQVRFPAAPLHVTTGQVVHTYAPLFTEQYKLVPAIGR